MANWGGNTNPYIKVYVNGELLRKFGGTRSKVRNMRLEYDRMNRQQFIQKHPILADFIAKKPCVITTEYYTPNQWRYPQNRHKHRA